jgi:hypothetical protein
MWTAEVSPYVKPTWNSTIYFTYNNARSLNTGGFANVLTWAPTGNKLNPLNFKSESDLWEAGVKVDLIPDTLFVSAIGFAQSRDTAPDINGNMARLKVKGAEGVVRFQPDRHLAFAGNFTYINARYTFIIPAGFSPFGFYTDNATVWGDSNRLNQRTGAEYDAAGIPKTNLSGYASYQFDSGFGAQLSGWWTSSWYVNLSKTVKVPSEFQLDLQLFYRRRAWSASVALLNLTDEKNFVNGLAGSTTEFLQPMRPFSERRPGAPLSKSRHVRPTIRPVRFVAPPHHGYGYASSSRLAAGPACRPRH